MKSVIEKNRWFYNNCVADLIHGKFSEYEDHIAVGIAGFAVMNKAQKKYNGSWFS